MKTCSFIGHRNVKETAELCEKLKTTVIRLIEDEKVGRFLFGSMSKFDELCLKIVTEIKEKYMEIKRVYVRSQYPYLDERYKKYLLELYDDTFLPEGVENAGRASYVERNQAMIKESDFCVFYYNADYKPAERKYSKKGFSTYQPESGTKLAYEYAQQKQRGGKEIEIINLFTAE